MILLKVSAVAMVGLLALLILKQFRPEWGSMIRLGMTVVMLCFLLSMVTTVLDFAHGFGGDTLLPTGMWQTLMKALGVTLITEVSASICRDCGEAGVAQWVETAGRLEILVLSLPLIADILATAKDLLSVA